MHSAVPPIRTGLIGCGTQALGHYVPFLQEQAAAGRVRVGWISGYLPSDGRVKQIAEAAAGFGCPCHPGEQWRELLGKVDAVVVSLPNKMHGPAIRAALEAGRHVLVDKPTTISPRECEELVQLAADRGLVFVTASQRRYEDVYQAVKRDIAGGGIGNLVFAQYLLTHPHYDRGKAVWTASRQMAGGGSLIQSGYHGLDTLLWLLKHTPERFGGPPTVESVSAECRYEVPGADGRYTLAAHPAGDEVESFASLRMRLSNGAVMELTASYANPAGSVDEVFKIVGDGGMIRYDRQRPVKADMKPGSLSYQSAEGGHRAEDTAGWQARRTAPAEDFLTAVAKVRAGEPWSVLAPASESVETLRIIRAAYRSAELGGAEVAPTTGPFPSPVHHVAVQTGRYADAIRFYTEVLGMRVLSDRPFKRRTVAWLKAGNTRVELFSNRAGEELVPWSDRFAGPIHLAFEVENLREFLAFARERGARMHPSHPEPFTPPVPGAKEIAYLLGPDGEELEVRERD